MLTGALREYTRLEIITEPRSKLQKSLRSLKNVAVVLLWMGSWRWVRDVQRSGERLTEVCDTGVHRGTTEPAGYFVLTSQQAVYSLLMVFQSVFVLSKRT